MTPDKLIDKYKENVVSNLDKEDAEILNAYINLETTRRADRRHRTSVFFDWAGLVLLVAFLIALVGGGLASLIQQDNYTEGYNTAISEQEHVLQQLNDEYKETHQGVMDGLRETVDKIEMQNAQILLQKKTYCETVAEGSGE